MSLGLGRADDTQTGRQSHNDHQADQPAPQGRFLLSPRPDQASSWRYPKSAHPSLRRPISPPPLKRSSTGASSRADVSSSAPSARASPSNAVSDGPMARLSGVGISAVNSQRASPPISRETPTDPRFSGSGARQTQKSPSASWTVAEIADRLTDSRQEVKNGHAQLVAFAIESTDTTERRTLQGNDLFAGITAHPAAAKDDNVVKIKLKQHLKAKRDQREAYYKAVCVKTTKERVPRYRFHHVEIKKNVLTPNTMLTFVPHLRDLETSEESKYNLWLKELEDFDLKSGFKPMNREDKSIRTAQSERARTISLYLESWLDRLAIPGCNKSALISYMARQEFGDSITPQQKTDILNSQNQDDGAITGADAAAELFTEAFQRVFTDGQPPSKQISLRDVLLLDEAVDNIMDSKPTAKDGSSAQTENAYDKAEAKLASYCILGCLICFSHSCEHGEYDNQNCKHTFSLLSSRYHLRDILERRQLLPENGAAHVNGNGISTPACRRKCYRSVISYPEYTGRPMSNEDIDVLHSLFVTANHSKVKRDPICLAADFLNRDCYHVYGEFEKLEIFFPRVEPKEKPRVKNLPWYDRHKKALLGDWQDHTVSHEYQRRELGEPCFHEGPCAPKVCSCVDAGILCEKFCGCSVESCAYKFTGCACHSQGKTCQRKHNDKSSCICILLNRECDPSLCGTCGAFERADPANAEDEGLHSTGCQNCVLQRGATKALLLGQSQLEGVGYGLFTAQDIAQDDFVVEYVGELIFHDEGVRREARRGDVFDEESTISYLFTLLENEGIWVDAAIYGNMSRYINHAPEGGERGCNITPRILYVNGEFRIKFTALRDIKAGEELFFNYGEEFPNLTKKLLDEKVGDKPESATRKGGRPKRADRDDRVARKAPKTDAKKPEKARGPVKAATAVADDEDVAIEDAPETVTSRRSRKRKRNTRDDSDDDEYRPGGTDATQKVSESGVESDAYSPTSLHRLRTRARPSRPASEAANAPSKGPNPAKPKGKRGGARPGSGRPRKHPRPVPKPAAGQGSVAQAAPPASTATPTTPPRQQQNRLRSANRVEEIDDSDDDGHAGAKEEEDDDQDVVVRKRVDRASRNRRLPAKFRDEEIWG